MPAISSTGAGSAPSFAATLWEAALAVTADDAAPADVATALAVAVIADVPPDDPDPDARAAYVALVRALARYRAWVTEAGWLVAVVVPAIRTLLPRVGVSASDLERALLRRTPAAGMVERLSAADVSARHVVDLVNAWGVRHALLAAVTPAPMLGEPDEPDEPPALPPAPGPRPRPAPTSAPDAWAVPDDQDVPDVRLRRGSVPAGPALPAPDDPVWRTVDRA